MIVQEMYSIRFYQMFVCIIVHIGIPLPCFSLCMKLHSDLWWSQRRPGAGNVRGWRSWRVQLPTASPGRTGREQLLASHWSHTERVINQHILGLLYLGFLLIFYDIFFFNGPTCDYVSRGMTPVRTPRPTRLLPSPSHVPTDCLRGRRRF